ncbi:MAG: hypothetical protein VB127_09090 [Sphaerochaeta sp.]|nr:hypothetical protein [Sphaerochaeta sp.]
MKRIRILFTIALIAFTLIGCATTNIPVAEELPPAPPAPVEELSVPSPLADIKMPQRYLKAPPVKRYGPVVGVINSTGYTLTTFDLFSDAMYLKQDAQVNLLGEDLEDGKQALITLSQYPELETALSEQDGSLFSFNAIDGDGDFYYGTWDPERESWNIEIIFDSIQERSYANLVPSFGDSIVVINHTGYPLEALYLESKHFLQLDGSETNLLYGEVLDSTRQLRIPTKELTALSEHLTFDAYATLYLTAIDRDGDRYQVLWHPTTDLWAIELTSADLNFPQEGRFFITVANETERTLWYLHAATTEAYEDGYLGEDLMGLNILDSGEELEVALSDVDAIADALGGASDEVIHLVALTSDGVRYHRTFVPYAESRYVVFEERDRDGEQEKGPKLTLYNETPSDLWFLYLASDEMIKQKELGRDLLGDEILDVGDVFSFSLSLSHSEEDLNLYAYDADDQVYHKRWNRFSDGLELTFTAEDLAEDPVL